MIFFEEFRVDGQPILVPDADVAVTQTDLDASDAGRDESGVMHRIPVRYRIKTWEFSYTALTGEEYAYMQSLFAGKPQFTFTYREDDGNIAHCIAYCSNSSICYHNARLNLYKNYKFTVIEC